MVLPPKEWLLEMASSFGDNGGRILHKISALLLPERSGFSVRTSIQAFIRFHRFTSLAVLLFGWIGFVLPLPLPAATFPSICPQVLIPAEITIPEKPKDAIRVVASNLEDLYAWISNFQPDIAFNIKNFDPSHAPQKPKVFRDQIAKTLIELDGDVVVAPEVESSEAATRFLTDYPEFGKGRVAYTGRTNDPFGVRTAQFIKLKKGEVVIYDDTLALRKRWDPFRKAIVPVFTRNAGVMLHFNETSKGIVSSSPYMITISVHIKSKRGRSLGTGKGSRGMPSEAPMTQRELQRIEEFNAILAVTKGYQQKYGNDIPIIVAGDLNAAIPNDPILTEFNRYFVDSFAVAARATRPEERMTQSFHQLNKDGSEEPAVYSQYDTVSISRGALDAGLVRVLMATVVRFRDEQNQFRPLAKTFDERSKQPGDHFYVATDLEIVKK